MTMLSGQQPGNKISRVAGTQVPTHPGTRSEH